MFGVSEAAYFAPHSSYIIPLGLCKRALSLQKCWPQWNKLVMVRAEERSTRNRFCSRSFGSSSYFEQYGLLRSRLPVVGNR